MNKLLYRDHQFLFVEDRNKDIDIPSNKRIFEDYIKDTIDEGSIESEISLEPGMIVRRKGSLASISMISKRIADFDEGSSSQELDINYSDSKESSESKPTSQTEEKVLL